MFEYDYGKFNDLVEKLETDSKIPPYRTSEVLSVNNETGKPSHYVEFIIDLKQYSCFMISETQRTGIGSYYGGINSNVMAYVNKIRVYNNKVIGLMNNKVVYESDKHHIKGNYSNSELTINIEYKHLK